MDASDVAVGAELAQRGRDQHWRPIAFFSRTLAPAEKKYSAFDRELLAIFPSIKHFRHFLESRSFIVFTDHKPLTFALSRAPGAKPWYYAAELHSLSVMSTYPLCGPTLTDTTDNLSEKC